jgi:PleD family two-component response regulator
MEAYVATSNDRAAERDQMDRQHILLVNSDPAILDLARVLLGEARYNVTTTNAVPRTFALIAAAQPALLVVDLAVTEYSGWDLLARLHAEPATAAIPVIVTARDPRLLAYADRYPHIFGGPGRLALLFDVTTMLDAVRALIGPA